VVDPRHDRVDRTAGGGRRGFTHQIVETFSTVGQSDPAWTEKVCGMASARDGSVQIGFGFGKYANRNVVDAYAGISRGREPWTVRASRLLASDPDGVSVGPIHHEIINTGFHLGAGLYHGFEGRHHGSWRGELQVEGEYFADCTTPESAARLNQFRDCMIRVEDPVGDGVGWGNCQTYVAGAWPDHGLTGEDARP